MAQESAPAQPRPRRVEPFHLSAAAAVFATLTASVALAEGRETGLIALATWLLAAVLATAGVAVAARRRQRIALIVAVPIALVVLAMAAFGLTYTVMTLKEMIAGEMAGCGPGLAC